MLNEEENIIFHTDLLWPKKSSNNEGIVKSKIFVKEDFTGYFMYAGSDCFFLHMPQVNFLFMFSARFAIFFFYAFSIFFKFLK